MDPFYLHHWPLFSTSSRLLFAEQQKAYIDDVTIDSRTIKGESALFIALKGSRSDGHLYIENALQNGARFAVVTKEWQKPPHILENSLIRVDNTLYALQNLAQCIRQERAKNIPVIAIGGCTGKTMLKDLLTILLDDVDNIYTSPESYNSQIGVALSLIHMPRSTSIAFIEVAANQTGEMKNLIKMLNPTNAVVTNFFKTRFGIDILKEVIALELEELIRSIPESNWKVAEKTFEHPFSQKKQSPFIYYWNDLALQFPTVNISNITTRNIEITITYENGRKTKKISLETTFTFIVELIQIGLTICHLLKLEIDKVIDKLAIYKPQTMRTEIWRNGFGTTFVNSTYSRETFSFAASLEDIPTFLDTPIANQHVNRAIIFGGLRLQQFAERQKKRIIESLKNLHINHIYFWPKETHAFLDTSQAHQAGMTVIACENISSALNEAIKNPPRGVPFQTILVKGADKTPVEQLFHMIEDTPPQTYVTINLASIQHNIELIKQKLGPSTKLMIIVKALAYGTDDMRIAHFLRKCGIDTLGVSYVDEGITMRKRGVEQHIFVINAKPDEMGKAIKWNLEVGVGTSEQIDEAIKQAQVQKSKVKLHLHVDTGMKRFGCNPEQAIVLAKKIAQQPHLLIFEGLFTHFSSADDPDQDNFTIYQAKTLEEIVRQLKKLGIVPKYIHAANSAAALRFHFPTFNMARIGLATYGISTSQTLRGSTIPLRPALSLVTKIAGINQAHTGDTVSYGRTHIVKDEKASIAVLPIGYHDGLHRAYSSKSEVLIRGCRAPMIGKICMDYMMVDVTHIPGASVGDPVFIFGEDDLGNFLSLEEFAQKAGSIPHELMTCLGQRIQRIFIYDESLRTR